MKSSFYKIFIPILLGALIILVSLPFISRTPSINQDDVELKKALLIIEKGEQPMKGIMMLRALLEKDPNNIDVIWQLGDLSIQSGQYPKAVGRFKRFVDLTEGDEKVSGLIKLSDSYFFDDKRQKALETLLQAKELDKDSKLKEEIQERINIINQN